MKKNKKKYFGDKVYLSLINRENLSKNYKSWIKDKEIKKFLEFRFDNLNHENINNFIKNIFNSKKDFFFGIFDKETNSHIGNIKIGNINFNHKSAEVGFLLGEKSFARMGIMTEALKIATFISFNNIKLKYLCGYVYEKNIPSIKVFKKNNYKLSGIFKKKVILDKKRINLLCFEKLN